MKKIKLAALSLLISTSGVISLNTGAQAGCNFHGCSQVPGVECNFHGCPNPPNGAECNFHGCPPATQEQKPQQQQGTYPPPIYPPPYMVYPGYPPYPPSYQQQTINQRSQAKPEEIANCMKSLMWRETAYGRFRTEIGEQTAIKACTGGQ